MFGRRASQSSEEPSESPGHEGGGKGRPTPSRREAEAARKQTLKIPKDPKAAKAASRERAREARQRQRQGMLAGDPRYLPARDQGAGRAFARDFVDSRFTLAETFIFVAILVLVLGFIRNPVVQQWVSIGFFAFTAVIVVDMAILLITLSSRAKKQFADPKERKGLALYAALRAMQIRRLRVPPPRVKIGGAPRA